MTSDLRANTMRIKTVMNHNQNDGLLKMIRRTDPLISTFPLKNLEVSKIVRTFAK